MGEYVRFLTTIWTTIREARRGDPKSVKEMLQQYSPPLRAYIRNRGIPDSETDDVLQEVLMRISDESFLKRAEQENGRFRSVLLGVTNNMILKFFERRRAIKRGGGSVTLSLEEISRRDASPPVMAPESQQDFDQLWFEHAFRTALRRLRDESLQTHRPYYQILQLRMDNLSYRDIAEQLGLAETEIGNLMQYGKRQIQKYVREYIRSYCSPAEYDDEYAAFRRVIAKNGRIS